MTFYLVQHLHLINKKEEDIKTIGVFSSKDEAVKAIDIVKKSSGFKNFPDVINPLEDDNIQGFYINSYEINTICWSEGYITV